MFSVAEIKQICLFLERNCMAKIMDYFRITKFSLNLPTIKNYLQYEFKV